MRRADRSRRGALLYERALAKRVFDGFPGIFRLGRQVTMFDLLRG
jgi:hypothetical protein